jgi:hypothetical protein
MADDAAREIKRRVAWDDENSVPSLYHIQPGYIDLDVIREPSALKGLAQEFTRELRRGLRPGGKVGHVLSVAVAHVARIGRLCRGSQLPRSDDPIHALLVGVVIQCSPLNRVSTRPVNGYADPL